jgi:hypothetical protein
MKDKEWLQNRLADRQAAAKAHQRFARYGHVCSGLTLGVGIGGIELLRTWEYPAVATLVAVSGLAGAYVFFKEAHEESTEATRFQEDAVFFENRIQELSRPA